MLYENIQNRAFAKQTLELNRMKGMLEDETNAKKRAMLKSMQQHNQQIV